MIFINTVLFTFLLVFIAFIECAYESSDLCHSCECQPNKMSPVTVVCRDTKTKNLRLTGGSMLRMQRTRNFTITGYRLLTFEKNSFRQLTELENLIIDNIERVTFPTGVFSSLQSLSINNVPDLWIISKAFMGVRDMKTIAISNSKLPDLPQYSFFDIVGIKEISLTNVTIETVQNESLQLQMDPLGKFILSNSHIVSMEENALSLKADEIEIHSTTFDNIAPNAIILEANKVINISACTFKETNGAKMTAPSTILKDNHFDMINAIALNKISIDKGNSFEFENNFIKNLDVLIRLDFMEGLKNTFHNNTIGNCKCDTTEYSYDSLWKKIPKYIEVLHENYCRSSCKVSLYEFALNHKNLCDEYTNSEGNFNPELYCANDTDVPATTDNSIREGKEVNFTDTKSTSSNKSTSSATNISGTSIGSSVIYSSSVLTTIVLLIGLQS